MYRPTETGEIGIEGLACWDMHFGLMFKMFYFLLGGHTVAPVWRLEENLWRSLLPACVSWGLNSGRPALQEVHLPSEPSLQPRYVFLKFWKGA